MKQLLEQYAAYNYWATKTLLDRLTQLPLEILLKDMNSSFGNIFNTFKHLMTVESIWWQRIKLSEHVEAPKDPQENLEELTKMLLSSSKHWMDWVSETSEKNLTHVFGHQNSKKEYSKQPVYEVLLHLFNHQTYHRGQIVTMMRQNGIDKIPATDFIVFSRKKIFSGKKI